MRCGTSFALPTPRPSQPPEDDDAPWVPIPAIERLVPRTPEGVAMAGLLSAAPLLADYRSYGLRSPEPVQIRFRQPGRKAASVALLVPSVFAFLCTLVVLAVVQHDYEPARVAFMLLYALMLAFFAILITMGILASNFNTIQFDLDAKRLLVTTGPFRWPWEVRRVSVPVGDIRQLSVLTKMHPKPKLHTVVAHLHDGSTLELANHFPAPEIAHFFEQAIEYQLGLPDEPWMNQLTE